MTPPIHCHLWALESPSEADITDAFETVETFSEDDHFSRRLVRCRQCGQLYLKEFYEEVDWVHGDDPQYSTHIPVDSAEEARDVNQAGRWDLQTVTPRLNLDWPSGEEKKIYWQR